ncbi:MAG: hypothetical protein GEV06_19805 [Luteitalea sp.]|nr:hypothetical protein [Luteitalea sp.]
MAFGTGKHTREAYEAAHKKAEAQVSTAPADTTPATPEAAPPAISGLSLADLQALMGSMTAAQTAALQPLLEKVGQTNATAMRSALVKHNPDYNEVSPFTHPEGEKAKPKAKLSRPTYFGKLDFQGDREVIIGAKMREDDLTPDEVDLFNRITKTCRAGKFKAEVRDIGSGAELHVGVPLSSDDDKLSLPSLVDILLALNGQPTTTTDLRKRIEELEAKNAELEALIA